MVVRTQEFDKLLFSLNTVEKRMNEKVFMINVQYLSVLYILRADCAMRSLI